ncbi:unannotated protein [freshwater metagenome]|uniref:Unannotated protein n=1 Tax=freshwater metagenome TaxID=449393 RepID=A0A6J6NU01_9ZZZZ
MQQRDAGDLRALELGYKDHGSAVAASTSHEHISLGGNAALGAHQRMVALDTRCDIA